MLYIILHLADNTDIYWYINQREFMLLNVNLFRANKCIVYTFLALIYNEIKKQS